MAAASSVVMTSLPRHTMPPACPSRIARLRRAFRKRGLSLVREASNLPNEPSMPAPPSLMEVRERVGRWYDVNSVSGCVDGVIDFRRYVSGVRGG